MVSTRLVKPRWVLDTEEHRHPVHLHMAEAIRHMANPRGLVVFERPSVVLPKFSNAFLSTVRALQFLLPSILRRHQAILTLETNQ